MLKVTIEDYEQLSDEEKESAPDSGCGKEYASYIRIIHNNETIRLESDASEPEDRFFHRDLLWIPDVIMEAYRFGKEDARK